MKDGLEWDRVGWQGIAFDVPADWCPGKVEGDFANGYMRVEDELRVRLEVKWETARGKVPGASQLVDNYIRQSRKKLPRKAPPPQIDRGRYVPALKALDHEAFTWRGTYNAHSLLLVAPSSRRVAHLRVFFEAGDEQRELTRRVFASVRAEPVNGRDEWAAFGFRFEVENTWRLEQSGLRTGCLQFLFRNGSDELEVVRLSLAEVVLRKRGLKEWFGEFFAKRLRGFTYEAAPWEREGEEGIRCSGLLRLRARPLGLLRGRRRLSALAWHCRQSDKLYALRLVSGSPDDPRLAACARSIRCH